MATVTKRTPPLSPGDNLSRDEFLRRWARDPDIKKAELLGGIVYMPSPVSLEHGDMESDVGGWLFMYKVATPGTACGHNITTFLLDDTAQPDLNLRILPEYGGASYIERKYLAGTPELLVEISRSSASLDMHQKLELYQEAGVPEYVAVLVYEKEIRWHMLDKRGYRLLEPDDNGIWRSRVFRGLWLNGPALLARDIPQVLATLQEGLDSQEHQDFVKNLAESKSVRKKRRRK